MTERGSLIPFLRGYVLGCRVGMPCVVIVGTVLAFLGHPFVGVATTLLATLGTTLAWVISLERLQ